MKSILTESEEAGLQENRLQPPGLRSRTPLGASPSPFPERWALAGGVMQPHFQPEAELSLHPIPGFADTLRSLYASERFGLSAKFCRRLVELLALAPRWDGEEAKAPRPEVLANIVGLLVFMKTTVTQFQEPFLAPTIAGFAQLEWHNDRRSLEFEAADHGWSIVGAKLISRGDRTYHEAEAARFEIEKLIACYRWFEGAELLWPFL